LKELQNTFIQIQGVLLKKCIIYSNISGHCCASSTTLLANSRSFEENSFNISEKVKAT
jgi:hypothetical protein